MKCPLNCVNYDDCYSEKCDNDIYIGLTKAFPDSLAHCHRYEDGDIFLEFYNIDTEECRRYISQFLKSSCIKCLHYVPYRKVCKENKIMLFGIVNENFKNSAMYCNKYKENQYER